ncbi:MAG: Gfo/Idh/MocA family oxidoreductase, partial [Actinobacteria bacterium]|nr:Gfo/Idh/MocA family oxidoreductase [Actinomycetota bacterium]
MSNHPDGSNDHGCGARRVLVCGTKFGQLYLQALSTGSFGLAGVLAQGSNRSRACADHWGVPLFTRVDDVPPDVRLACVVVRGGLLGGPGTQLALSLLDRGVHVLQEHPVHYDELAACLRRARANSVAYRLNSFYVHLEPVRRFLAVAAELFQRQRPLYVDAACGFQVAYALLDIIATAIGRVRPWGFAEPVEMPTSTRALIPLPVPFRSLDGVIGGVPVTLRVQNQLDPSDPDNYAHLL